MSKTDINKLLKQRMSSTQKASELQVGETAYETLFQSPAPVAQARICEIPVDRLRPFFSADIGFKPYPPDKLKAFAEQLAGEGLFERIIVRPIPGTGNYEIIAGHNRTAAARLIGWHAIPAEVITVDDEKATTIAVATNLLRRQDLTIIERGKAYKALLDAKNKNGQRPANDETFGEFRQRYNARAIVAEFFGVTEYEIRKAVKLTQLIPELGDILETSPKSLPLSCAELIADYTAEAQEAFVEMCRIEGYHLTMSEMRHIAKKCPPPAASQQSIYAAWREARAATEKKASAQPKEIRFDRKRFAPYLKKLKSDAELEDLFYEFLQSRFG